MTADLNVILDNVPTCLLKPTQWVAWQYVERDDKQTKVPISPTRGGTASSTDPRTWGTFEQAVTALRRCSDIEGVGFVFTAADPYCGVDLDECIVDGQIAPEAQAIIKDLASYAEISPSGTGIKIFVMATKPQWAGCKSTKVVSFKHVEIYDCKRYFTVTGNHLPGTPLTVEHRQEQILALCEHLWSRRSAPSAVSIESRTEIQSSALTVDMAMREKRCLAYVAKCPDAISGDGGHDSTLRVACECYRFGLDESAAWRLMRWFNEKKTGGERWTDNELEHKLDSARQKIEAAGEFGARLSGLDSPESSLGIAQVASLLTDVGNAARLVKRFGDKIRYCHGLQKWLIWDGRRWKPDDVGRIVKLCKNTALSILDEARKAPDDARGKLTGWATTSQRRDRLTAMAALAQPEVAVAIDDLDADPWAFNCLNGAIDLQTGTLRPHAQIDLITKLAPVDFDPAATCPRFDQFLREVFAGDEDLITFVQRCLGMSLTGDVREQLLPIFYGEGNNGKNVLLDTISALMGDYACEAPPELLTFSKHREHPTEIADLCGRRLVIASETEEAATLRLQLVFPKPSASGRGPEEVRTVPLCIERV